MDSKKCFPYLLGKDKTWFHVPIPLLNIAITITGAYYASGFDWRWSRCGGKRTPRLWCSGCLDRDSSYNFPRYVYSSLHWLLLIKNLGTSSIRYYPIIAGYFKCSPKTSTLLCPSTSSSYFSLPLPPQRQRQVLHYENTGSPMNPQSFLLFTKTDVRIPTSITTIITPSDTQFIKSSRW